MYNPKQFQETRIEVLQECLRSHPFAALVTLTANGLEANHIPFELDPEPSPYGTLRGHIARANPLWREALPDTEALAIFQGPNTYITPSWYPSKQQTGQVVPTWNYIVVHAYGHLRIIDDPIWLKNLVEKLTDRNETGRAEPWQVEDAPDEFIGKMLGAIVGLELPITRLSGKWKLSQNRPEADRQGVIAGLAETDSDAARAMIGQMSSS